MLARACSATVLVPRGCDGEKLEVTAVGALTSILIRVEATLVAPVVSMVIV